MIGRAHAPMAAGNAGWAQLFGVLTGQCMGSEGRPAGQSYCLAFGHSSIAWRVYGIGKINV